MPRQLLLSLLVPLTMALTLPCVTSVHAEGLLDAGLEAAPERGADRKKVSLSSPNRSRRQIERMIESDATDEIEKELAAAQEEKSSDFYRNKRIHKRADSRLSRKVNTYSERPRIIPTPKPAKTGKKKKNKD